MLVLSALLSLAAQAPTATTPRDAPDASTEATPVDRGRQHLYRRPYQGFGLTADEFDRLWTLWPRARREAAEALTLDGRRALTRERYGLPLDPRRAPVDGVDVPVAFAAEPGSPWTLNCLACHGGDVRGEYVEGLGNSRFAFQTLVRDVLWLRRKDRVDFTEQEEGMAVVTLNASDGTTNAQVFSAVLLALRDRELERLEEPERPLLEGILEHDLDAPPLWNVRHKSRLYCDGYIEKDPRVIMQFALALENDGATVRSYEPDFVDVLAWIESLEAPDWPYDVDADLAARGAVVFAEHCAGCHGTYGPGGLEEYPERRVPIADVGTDGQRLVGLPRAFKRRLGESWLGREGAVDVELDADGYVAPPLEGVWASAPYLHNGSVPTLWHLLHPDSRPAAWKRRSADGYDPVRVGLLVDEAQAVPELKRADERRRWFDTGYTGKSAGGHDYPSSLDEAERRALLEYLKTL